MARLDQLTNRVRDLEGQDKILRKALTIAASKLGTTVDELVVQAEKSDSAPPASETKATEGAMESSEQKESSSTKHDAAESMAAAPEDKKPEKDGEDKDDSKGREQKRFKAKVLYDYTAQQDYEMTIRVNEVITVLSKHGNGWWLGATADGKQGYFPGSYVEPLGQEA